MLDNLKRDNQDLRQKVTPNTIPSYNYDAIKHLWLKQKQVWRLADYFQVVDLEAREDPSGSDILKLAESKSEILRLNIEIQRMEEQNMTLKNQLENAVSSFHFYFRIT